MTDDINFRKAFANNIRDLRKLAGLTQEQLSERLGINPKSLSYLENGHTNISFAKIPLLAKALGVPIYRLFIFGNVQNPCAVEELVNSMDEHERAVAIKMLKLLMSLKQAKNIKNYKE